MKLFGEITFDTYVDELSEHHLEGCYRQNGQDWKVFYFTHRANGKWWQGDPIIRKDAVWQSGITGVDALLPYAQILNKATVIEVLSAVLDV